MTAHSAGGNGWAMPGPITSTTVRCPWCLSGKEPIEVHGHRQCPDCGTVTEPCCQGVAFDVR